MALQLRPYGPGSLNSPWLRSECRESWGAGVARIAGWDEVNWSSPLGKARELARQGELARSDGNGPSFAAPTGPESAYSR